jgi:hypothetical protein
MAVVAALSPIMVIVPVIDGKPFGPSVVLSTFVNM